MTNTENHSPDLNDVTDVTCWNCEATLEIARDLLDLWGGLCDECEDVPAPESAAHTRDCWSTTYRDTNGMHVCLPGPSSAAAEVTEADLTAMWSSETSATRLRRLAERLESFGSVFPLTRLDYLSEIVEDAERLRATAVKQARADGETWSAIAANIGVSKQAAQSRYGK